MASTNESTKRQTNHRRRRHGLPSHLCLLTGVLSKQCAAVVDQKGGHVDALGVVSLPDVEDGLEGREEAVLQFLWGEAKQPKIGPERVGFQFQSHAVDLVAGQAP